jgi:NB-ARC domain
VGVLPTLSARIVATTASSTKDDGAAPLFVVPFLRHGDFVGREEDLKQLHTLLQTGRPVGVRPVAAAGMGGIGKTQLAVEYAYRHKSDYPGGVFWVNAARDVQTEMAALAEHAGLFEDQAPEAERRRRRVLAFVRFLDARPEALLILDNVEDPRSLRNEAFGFMPAKLGCRVLFTSRRHDDRFATVAVGALPEAEALDLLVRESRRAWGEADREVAREVCRMLGCLPLALALAGAFLAQNPRVTVRGYRERLREGPLAAVDAAADEAGVVEDDLPTRHAAAVEATLGVQWKALARLPGGGEAERRVLQAAALLGEAAEVPRARLALLTGLGEEAEKEGYAAPLGVALQRLREMSLVEALGEKAIRLHPLVREFAARQIAGREGFAADCAGNLGEALWDMGRLNDEVAERGVDQGERTKLDIMTTRRDSHNATRRVSRPTSAGQQRS